jgi:tRNA A37 threonylcarbamoyladenosine modification protein TsaB
MITVCLDTSHIFLVIALIEDGKMLASVQEKCWKKQNRNLQNSSLCLNCSSMKISCGSSGFFMKI